MNAKKTQHPDLEEILGKLGELRFPVLGADPVTAGLNAATVAMLLIMTIINTVPPDQHAENWERIDRILDRVTVT